MNKLGYALTAAMLLLLFGMVGASTLASASVSVGSLIASTNMHVLNVTGVTTSDGTPLAAGSYGFYLNATPSQQSGLVSYFNAKGWPSGYYPIINAEIAGTVPFFYLNSNGAGEYGLEDGFQYALSSGALNAMLQIDDDYPAGAYGYIGNVASSSVSVSLAVSQPFSISTSVSVPTTTIPPTNVTISATGSNTSGIVIGSDGGIPCASCAQAEGQVTVPYYDVYTNSVWVLFTNQTQKNTGIGIDSWKGLESWLKAVMGIPSLSLPMITANTTANMTV